MGNAVCRRCWDRVQIASRARENDGSYRGGIRCVWLNRVGKEGGDSPDAGTGEGAAAGGDTSTTSTGAGDSSSRPEVQPGPPVRIPGGSHYRRRRPHARYQLPHQNRLRMLQEVLHRALRPAKREEGGDSPDVGTGEGAAAGGDTNTTSTGAEDRSSRPEVQPGPPVRIPGRPHYRRRRPYARYQPPHQNHLGKLQEVLHRALRPAKHAIKAQGSVAEGGGHGGSAVRVHDVGSA